MQTIEEIKKKARLNNNCPQMTITLYVIDFSAKMQMSWNQGTAELKNKLKGEEKI